MDFIRPGLFFNAMLVTDGSWVQCWLLMGLGLKWLKFTDFLHFCFTDFKCYPMGGVDQIGYLFSQVSNYN